VEIGAFVGIVVLITGDTVGMLATVNFLAITVWLALVNVIANDDNGKYNGSVASHLTFRPYGTLVQSAEYDDFVTVQYTHDRQSIPATLRLVQTLLLRETVMLIPVPGSGAII
jgi:hypothetical protein